MSQYYFYSILSPITQSKLPLKEELEIQTKKRCIRRSRELSGHFHLKEKEVLTSVDGTTLLPASITWIQLPNKDHRIHKFGSSRVKISVFFV